MTSAEDIGPFDCRLTTLATTSTCPTDDDADFVPTPPHCHLHADTDTDDFFVPPPLSSHDADAESVVVCRWPMGARYPMEYETGSGFAVADSPIILRASAPTSSRVPSTPDETVVHIFEERHSTDEHHEEEEEESDRADEPSTSNDAAVKPKPMLLGGVNEFDPIIDFGVDCPTSLLAISEEVVPEEAPTTPKRSIHETLLSLLLPRSLVDDSYIDRAVDLIFAPHHLTAFQRVGAVRRLLYPLHRTSVLTPVLAPPVVFAEPNTAPVPYMFYDEITWPAAMRAHRLLREPFPPPLPISQLLHVQGQNTSIDLTSVRFHKRGFAALDELLPGTIIPRVFMQRPKRVPWRAWHVVRVFPARFRASLATRSTKVAPLPAQLATPLDLSPDTLLLAAPPPPPLHHASWESEMNNATGAPRARPVWPLRVTALEMLRSMGVHAKPTILLADSVIANSSLSTCDVVDEAVPAVPEMPFEVADHVAALADSDGSPLLNSATCSALATIPLALDTPTPTARNSSTLFTAGLALVELVYIAYIRRERNVAMKAAKAAQRAGVFNNLNVRQARHRMVRARLARVHQRLRAAAARQQIDSLQISLDAASAPNSRRGALRRARPRSARLAAVAPLLKRNSLAVSNAKPKRPVSARATARKSADQPMCLAN